jgi:hypothetical protein
METDVDMEIRKTGFPHRLAKRLLAFRTVPTGPAAINQQTTKPDRSLATKTRHFHLLPTGAINFLTVYRSPWTKLAASRRSDTWTMRRE